MKITQLNHVAIYVSDLEKSQSFYGNVLGLQKIDRPAFSFPGAWFRIGADQELHLIARAPDHPTLPEEWHFALKIESVEDTTRALRERGISFRAAKQRPDGAWQIFLRDPDGYLIELCTSPPDTTSDSA